MAVPRNKSTGRGITRRGFLGGTAAAFAMPLIIPRIARGQTAANNRLGLGFIGLGGRGMGHVKSFMHAADVQVVAVCDPYRSKQQAAVQAVERHYAGRANRGDYKGCGAYSDFRELLARDDVDAVVIASPEFWHALQSVRAMEAGKDVFCEKALSLTVAEGRAVCDAVRRCGRVYQLGTQQRSSRNFRFACELARNGYLGKVWTVKVGCPGGRALPDVPPEPPPPGLDYEMWLGPAPESPYNKLKCTYNWYFIYDYCTGWIQSWGVHHVDIALWGAPSLASSRLEVVGKATFPEQGIANTSIAWRVEIASGDGVRLSFSDNSRHQQGCRFEGDQGWVHVNRSGIRAEPKSLLQVAIKPGEEHLYESYNHQQNFLECVRTRREPAAPVEGGHAATTITNIADIACRTGRTLAWDWKKHEFVNDGGANRFLSRPMRSPWTL